MTAMPRMFRNAPGRPIVLPPGLNPLICTQPVQILDAIRKRLTATIARALTQYRGNRVINSVNEAWSEPDSIHLGPYSNWNIDVDLSVGMDPEDNYPNEIWEQLWHPMEVSSPVLRPTQASWEEIRAVVRAIKAEYWTLTPRSAGLHFHYGYGKSYIPLHDLRRMAALCFAADPLLTQLHPEHRRKSPYCLSNRLYSRAAHGVTAVNMSARENAKYIEGAPEVPSTAQSKSNLPARPSPARNPNLSIPFKRGQLTGYTFNPYQFADSGFVEAQVNPYQVPSDIPDAVRQILQSANCPTVAGLMHCSRLDKDRPAYSFSAYASAFYRCPMQTDDDGQSVSQSKRTVEFRQMAATLDPDEIVAHGKVIVRLAEFAATSSLDDFWSLILDCAAAETYDGSYDVFDLLVALGLVDEANVLLRSVLRFRESDI